MNHWLLATTMSSGAESAFIAAYFGIIAIFVVAALAFNIVIHWKVASKAGYNGALSLLMLVPFVNFIVMILFAFSEWPIQRALRAASGGAPPPGGYGLPGGYVPPGGGGFAPMPSDVAANRNPYGASYPAPTQQQPPYGVPPPPQQPNWPADPPESF